MFRKLRSFVWPSFGFRLKTPQFPYCLPRNSVAARRQSDDKLLRCKFHLSSVCMLCVCCDARRGAAALSAVYECTLVVVTRAKQRGGRAETSNEQQQSFFAKQDLANVVVVVGGHEPPLTPPPPVDAIASRSPPLTDDQAVRLSKELPLAQHLELNRHHPDNGERGGEGELLLILH